MCAFLSREAAEGNSPGREPREYVTKTDSSPEGTAPDGRRVFCRPAGQRHEGLSGGEKRAVGIIGAPADGTVDANDLIHQSY